MTDDPPRSRSNSEEPTDADDDPDARPVACTLTESERAERSDRVESVLSASYRSASERPDGYTLTFDGTDGALPALGRFVAAERECCSFADYEIAVSPPYEEVRLAITGPEGTKAVFGELVDLLEGTAQ